MESNATHIHSAERRGGSSPAAAPMPTMRPRRHGMDYLLFLTVAAICAFGVVMLFSASYYYAQSFQGDGYYYVKKQLLFLAIGIPVMFGLSFVDYKFYRRFAWMAYLLIILLLIAVLLFGKNLQGGQRWLKIGPLQFQPSELAKFIIVICMAKYMTDHHEDMPSFVRGFLPMAALLVVPAVLIYFQPNVSMLIILCIVFAIMLFIGGASLSQLGIAALIGGAALVVLLFAASYRESRFTAWLDPWGNKSDAGYQIVQSLYAFGNGGWFCQGLDASRQKLLFLPYRESDFILSIIAEELGFVTVALLIAAYCFIIYRGIRIALSVRDRFASLVAAGFSSILAVQVAVNVAVVTNSIPATGQTLPFISSGGTSLVIFLAGIGVLLNISRYTEPRKSRGESYGKHKKQKQRQQ